ncbi:hypothetical protein K435DRAFT_174453 [Dendrothele bispora CBS 962.96]|uniref:Uncharacterized protein n=1 Tax=Dendrothele bispora (strain CBS 962.96) TaxID=1314807 RepID=A0A4S8MXU9_DENBC|nr:hypothetical protein K435DRAFT_174453 [Dendrothele bispora CBS 962.96]
MTTLTSIIEASPPEELNINITALITSAVSDDLPNYSLSQVHDVLKDSNVAEHLDPLNTLPSLLPYPDDAAQDVLGLMCMRSNPKEILIAAEEALERLHRTALENEEESDIQQNTDQKKDMSLAEQTLRLLRLLKAISRLQFRKKSAADTIRPLMIQLQSTIHDAANQFDRGQGRALMLASAELVDVTLDWTLTKENVSTGELRAFTDSTWRAGDSTMQATITTYIKLQENAEVTDLRTFPSIPSPPDQTILLVYAHWLTRSFEQKAIPSPRTTLFNLEALLPVILSSIQTNHFLEETLAVLLLSLYNVQGSGKQTTELSSDLIHPLFNVLPELASAHPEPQVRHYTFRILSMVLRGSPAMVRMQTLRSLTGPSDPDQPPSQGWNKQIEEVVEARRLQMRIASVGLVKEAVLEALQESSSASQNVFASPKFLQTFGPVLFRTQPEGYLEILSQKTRGLSENNRSEHYWDELRKVLEEEAELTRLVECLSLYYVVLLRDVRNWTGIRDKDNIANVEKLFLVPIRRVLDQLLGTSGNEVGPQYGHSAQLHAVMPLAALKLSLERVDDALKDQMR